MTRRELMILLGGVLTAARALRAEQRAMPVIGFLGSIGPIAPQVDAFHQGLSETGYVEGQNVTIEYRWAEGRYDRLPALAADLVGRKVDLIMATGGDVSALAAKSATSTIPIVFTGIGGDPVGLGLVVSLARPGGNVTGFSGLTIEVNPKRLELLTELVPQARVIALLVNPNNPNTERVVRDVQEAALAKGVQLPVLRADAEAEIDAAFASLVRLHAAALVVAGDAFFTSQRDQFAALASRHAVPAIYNLREFHRGRRPDQLRAEHCGCLAPGRHLRRKDSQRHEAGRPAGPATGDTRAGRQPQHRQGARPHRPAIDPRARRRGHRMRQANGRFGCRCSGCSFRTGRECSVFGPTSQRERGSRR
jgi:putative tryptophan/tyrosine transport system substrate-binding protein